MRTFRITHEIGAIEIHLLQGQEYWYLECKDDNDRREFIGHEAWRELWSSPAKEMLTRLCNSLGVTAVKEQFIANIKIEEV